MPRPSPLLRPHQLPCLWRLTVLSPQSVADSSWITELLWTFFVPFTVYQVRYYLSFCLSRLGGKGPVVSPSFPPGMWRPQGWLLVRGGWMWGGEAFSSVLQCISQLVLPSLTCLQGTCPALAHCSCLALRGLSPLPCWGLASNGPRIVPCPFPSMMRWHLDSSLRTPGAAQPSDGHFTALPPRHWEETWG